MANRHFPILGSTVAPMLGRKVLMENVLKDLASPLFDHSQVVGPHYGGKTVFLHELVRRLSEGVSPYTAVVLWDLGNETPATEALFMQRFALELSAALATNHPEYAEHLKTVAQEKAQENPYRDILDVFDALKDEGGKVLVIMDSFDKPLAYGRLTRDLLSNLRNLGQRPSLRYITASRKSLQQLIRDPDIEDSPFFNMFTGFVEIKCFDEQDVFEILGRLNGIHLNAGAKTELWNATNGFPLFLLEMLNVLEEDGRSGEITAPDVVSACDKALLMLNGSIEKLWGECLPSSQDLLRRVLDEQTVSRAGVAGADVDALTERGFVHQTGNKLQRPSRLLAKFLSERPDEGNALVRLFSTSDDYLKNLKGVMARRIAQIPEIDSNLKRKLERAVDDFPSHPGDFLSNVQGILERALALIWAAEFGSNKVPESWFDTWRYNDENKVYEDWRSRFPEGGKRIRLLDLMTGTAKSDRLAKYVTKNTYALADAIQTFRDFGVHPKFAAIDAGAAYAAFLVCIELAASLARELPTPTAAT